MSSSSEEDSREFCDQLVESIVDRFQDLSVDTTTVDNFSPQNSNFNQTKINLKQSNLNPKMALFKAEYLGCIPEFNGNPEELQRFINTCESVIVNFCSATAPNFQDTFILNSILNKLTGTARIIANIQSVQTWAELKTALTNHFGDQRDEPCLNRDLNLLRQNSKETPLEFYDKCLRHLNTICCYVNNHETTAEAKRLKCDFYREVTLRTFLAGLRDPLGTVIRSMRPSNLTEALQFIQQEDNLQHFKNFGQQQAKPPQPINNIFKTHPQQFVTNPQFRQPYAQQVATHFPPNLTFPFTAYSYTA